MRKLNVKISLLNDKAVVPSRSHSTDTGYDLVFTGVEKIVGDVIFFKTGISLQPPSGYYFEVVPRSSISKLPLEMANSVGVIDESYTGEVLVPVRVTHSEMGFGKGSENKPYPQGIVRIFNSRPGSMTILSSLILDKKPCLFQAILRKRLDCNFVIENLEDTERNDGGFGSTDELTIDI
jgi:dUTPase